ncbi:RluA family pseudouridine synthase [Lentisphaera profundi]|uniref:Pseudouridine synthase n=1 Tax=Lentisphaera profundi TaxID=1658616 RepID=A0ABY7VVI2_9BACT|nr:RluA family pseudouridine synthase [Lentisphaera profundi]WDE98238.1 RluA family pseudouridine synthase [Lentisphaera profundi]
MSSKVPKTAEEIEEMLRLVRKKITRETEGHEVLDFLCTKFTYRSREVWIESLQDGSSQINGKAIDDHHYILKAGDIVSLDVTNIPEPKIDADFKVIYEDEDMLMVEKTGDLPVHPAGSFFKNTLWYFLVKKYGNVHIMNRLDRETSGLVLVARHSKAASVLGKQFERRQVGKEYDVVVEGNVLWDDYVAKGFMGPAESSLIRKKFSFTEDENWQEHGKFSAHTDFSVLRRSQELSHLHCRLHTGRTHQIRATLLSLGFPLVGDKIYGLDEQFFLSFIDGALSAEDKKRMRVGRQALHCSLMSFVHPMSGEELVFKSSLPKELEELILS